MNIYLTDQSYKFPEYLECLCKERVMEYYIHALKETITHITVNTSKKIEQIAPAFLFNYQVFPGNIMAYLTQWNYEKREMKQGDTIVQQVFIPPNKHFSQKIIFGVRIKEIIKEQNRIGYSYETLEGHVEKGISTFTIEKTTDEKIIFRTHTHSSPATLITKMLGPIFSIPYQTYCTERALQNVKRIIESQE